MLNEWINKDRNEELGFPGSTVKNLPANAGNARDEGSIPGLGRVGKIPWRGAWQPTPVFLPREFPRMEETGGLQSMGLQNRTRLSRHAPDHDEEQGGPLKETRDEWDALRSAQNCRTVVIHTAERLGVEKHGGGQEEPQKGQNLPWKPNTLWVPVYAASHYPWCLWDACHIFPHTDETLKPPKLKWVAQSWDIAKGVELQSQWYSAPKEPCWS